MSDFNIDIRLRHDYGGWQVEVTGDEAFQVRPARRISAEEALVIAGTVAGAPRLVQAIIRQDADEAEEKARTERKRAKDEVVRQAESAFAAEQKARERRAEADRLAPSTEQPEPFTVE